MEHAETAEPLASGKAKAKDKVTGFNIRILDDGSFLLCEEHAQWEKREESSHDSVESVMAALKKAMHGGNGKPGKDELEK